MLDSRQLDTLSPSARSVFCLNLVKINQPHIDFWAEEFCIDPQPYIKLSAKLESYLIGELRSVSNLQRFYEEFCNWSDTLTDYDCLAQRIVNLCFSTICAAIDTLLDADCDDINLVISEAQQIIKEMEELGCEIQELELSLVDFISFHAEILQDVKQRPVAKNCLIQLNQDSSTLFGL